MSDKAKVVVFIVITTVVVWATGYALSDYYRTHPYMRLFPYAHEEGRVIP